MATKKAANKPVDEAVKQKAVAARHAARISKALGGFEALPNSAFARIPTIAALLGVSVPTIWRRSKDGSLPPTKKIGLRCTGMNVGQVREFLQKIA